MKKILLSALALLNSSLFAETSKEIDFATEALAQVVQEILSLMCQRRNLM